MTRIDADWLAALETRRVVDALEATRPGCIRFVGGCIRNAIMGRPVDDIDIATQLEPAQAITSLKRAGIRVVPTGIAHGTITAIVTSTPFEITSLRRDVETDGRRAVVAFTQDWAEDAQRRDFRLNALYASPDGEIFDPTGGGLEDAQSGRVVFIGDGDERLREDYLRILRFFRFNAWYGAAIDEDGLAACARQAEGLTQIARERTWKEVKKMLSAPQPDTALAAMANIGVLQRVLPGAECGEWFSALVGREAAAGYAADAMRRVMALLPRDLRFVANAAEALRMSNAEAERMAAWASPMFDDPTGLGEQRLRALLYWHGAEAVLDRALLSEGQLTEVLPVIENWQRPSMPLDGGDATKAGLSGEAVGEALRRIERYWVERDFAPPREELLSLLV